MDMTRSIQEAAALRDVAYVVRFGHFPGDAFALSRRLSGASSPPPLPPFCAPSGGVSGGEDEGLQDPSEGRTSPSPSSLASGTNNPFGDEEDEVEEPSKSLKLDLNPFGGEEDEEDDEERGGLRDDLPATSASSCTTTSPRSPLSSGVATGRSSPTTSQASPTTGPSSPTARLFFPASKSASPPPLTSPLPLEPLQVDDVTRSRTEEVISVAFNVTRLDLKRLIEDAGKNQEPPRVEILLEEIRTEGLKVAPLTGTSTPPLLFFRAVVSGRERYTCFSSTSATNTTRQSLTLTVNNMYREALVMEVWTAREPSVPEPQSGPVLDILGRLITGTRRAKKERETNRRPAGQAPRAEAEADDCDHADDTPVINTSLWEERKARGEVRLKARSPKDDSNDHDQHEDDHDHHQEPQANGDEARAWNGAAPAEQGVLDTTSIGSDHSADQLRTSTPTAAGRASSLQNLELSNVAHDDFFATEKKKPKARGLRSMGASLRSSFRKGLNHNNNLQAAEGAASPALAKRAPDANSIRSETSDAAAPFDEDDEGRARHNLTLGGETKGKGKSKLQRSLSTLSIASITKRSMSMRLASSKATEVFRRIGSMKERGYKKGSYSLEEAASSSKLSLQGLDDDVSQKSYTAEHNPFEEDDHDDSKDADRAQSPEVEAEGESPRLERVLAASAITVPRSIFNRWKDQRTLRAFRNLRERSSSKKPLEEDFEGWSSQNGRASPVADNPDGIREYLASIGKAHLKADLLGHVKIPIKDVVGTWTTESWFPMTLIRPSGESPKPKKGKHTKGGVLADAMGTAKEGGARCLCKLHVRVALPSPPSTELSKTAYDTYSITYRKLVDMQVENMQDFTQYKGEVGTTGDVILQQLTFFSRIEEWHRTLVMWLVLTRVKPLDPGLLLPLLKGVRDNLVARNYVTTQRREICTTLSSWVRHVLAKEFEMLHTSFPSTSLLVELPRLENYLRCFRTVENCYELRKPFEHELSTQGLPACVTDLLLAALSKHVDTWIDALYKEELKSPPSAPDSREVVVEVPTEWQVWQESLRRAGLLTNPILSFLAISLHTYQPILMIEMGVDYLYLVMPKLLMAAQMLVKPLLAFDVDEGLPPQQKEDVLPGALKAAWMLCDNLSEINKLTVKSDLPQHLIPQEYRHSFSSGLTHWLALSKHLAFGELDREVALDEFVALEDMEGFSHSAVGMVDLLRALMKRLSSVSWPGGVGPSVETMDTIAGHLLELVLQYKAKVTDAYNMRGGCTDKISVEVCVVVRNVEHVCDETRKHLLQLSSMCVDPEGRQKSLDLSERSKQLQSYIDDSAEELLKTCLPHLEQILEKGVTRGGPESVQKGLEEALFPVEDRLYFAEPLLHELWVRLFRHAMLLKELYVKSGWRERLRKLREVLTKAHTFLTDQQGVGFHLTQAATTDYETLQEDLKILGATSEELVALYYHERLRQQERESSSATAPFIVVNLAFVDTGLRVHVIQAPGQHRGVLVKARVEPKYWFAKSEPQKTILVKEDPAVFDQVLEFPEILEDVPDAEQGGVLTLQLRTPKILGNSVVHSEAIVPLKNIPRMSTEALSGTRHIRLTLTRPWKLSSYRPLEALRTRALDKVAVASLKDLAERWEPGDRSSQIQETQKIRATFARAGSMKSPSASAGKGARRHHGGSMRLGSVK
ncbi:uncharacterized protein LOC125038932 [Penaeus chinensis]|uniref:uncharacterized protein LOC125038932 n=1 Tax=Penaeus chinensis TaxID=139456 RepID=UPI001FB6B5E7|nr:uncharacterized protein LOC125038932 [Penaeus chinensis]XP_047488572.1 uncharacterized protein LOC125038932 [Penaeus chinensis]